MKIIYVNTALEFWKKTVVMVFIIARIEVMKRTDGVELCLHSCDRSRSCIWVSN